MVAGEGATGSDREGEFGSVYGSAILEIELMLHWRGLHATGARRAGLEARTPLMMRACNSSIRCRSPSPPEESHITA
ncbi:hypothetical protein ZHAS_00015576 [Anopheles sinensis]|uniref:Uncharacterized protein n=1 Tax=Anopheles sinensis TaxID=74873 RepID=A0A084WBL2_ANOSI|nr:hypothetical protein ZHAS_00015576 [Anopheles sinensis]